MIQNNKFLVILIYSKGFKNAYSKVLNQLKELDYNTISVKLELYCKNKNFNDWNEKNKFNYYLFKPLIIKDIIKKNSSYEFFFYIDVNDRPLFGLKEHIIKVFNSEKKIDFIVPGTKNPNLFYSHPYRIQKLNFFNKLKEFFLFQIEAGTIAIRNSSNTFEILDDWINTTSEIAKFNSQFSCNRSRHDQEALSKLSINKRNIKVENWFHYKFSKSNLRNYINYEFNIS